MAPSKDRRRPELIIPFQEPPAKSDSTDVSGAMSSTLPMAAMFTRNKFVGWAAVVFSIQNWLGESEESKKNAATPGYLNIFLAVMSLSVSYLPLFFPNQGAALGRGSSTQAPPPVPS